MPTRLTHCDIFLLWSKHDFNCRLVYSATIYCMVSRKFRYEPLAFCHKCGDYNQPLSQCSWLPFLLKTILYAGNPRRETKVKLLCNVLLVAMQWLLHFDWELLSQQLSIVQNYIGVQSVMIQFNFILTAGLSWNGSFLCNSIGFRLMIEELRFPIPVYIKYAS